jgi:hypothetical protein
MSQDQVTAFLKQLSKDKALRREFARLAARHGFDLTEVSVAELAAMARAESDSQAPSDGWFHTRASERRSGQDRRTDEFSVSVDRRSNPARRGRCG